MTDSLVLNERRPKASAASPFSAAMSLTPPGDLYFAVNDSLFLKAMNAVRSQRPSLLNYMSPFFAAHPEHWCSQLSAPPNGAPLFTPVPPLTLDNGKNIPPIELALQITDIGVGFGVDSVGLPPDLLPLPAQRVALKLSFNARFVVPRLRPDSIGLPPNGHEFDHAIFTQELCDCFGGTLATTASLAIRRAGPESWITFALDRFDASNLTPTGLRQTAGTLLVLALDTLVLPSMWVNIKPFVIDMSRALPSAAPIKSITIRPSAPTASPNPDIGGHLFRARFGLEVTAP